MTKTLNPIDFPLGGSRLIEASAGTGKTYTIAALYLRLVLGHGGGQAHPYGPLSPDQILVVTFTKAATEELKDRIRARLVEAAAVFRGEAEGDPIIKALKADFAETQLAYCARRLELAAQGMDQAAVHTIHSWCQRMLREHAFDSGSLFNLELQTDLSGLEEEATRDYWRNHFYPAAAAELEPITALYGSPKPLQKAIQGLLGRVDSDADPLQVAAEQQAAVAQCKRIWRLEFAAVEAMVTEALEHKRLKYVKLDQLTELEQWLNSDAVTPKEATAKRFTTTGMQSAAKKGEQPLESPAFAAMESLLTTLARLDLKQSLMRHSADWIHQRVQADKQRLALMGHDDLILNLGAALADDVDQQLAGKIRHQFPVALIDEFQDTDPVQYRIFSSLYLNQPDTGLMMIGDPKQAIYGFRGADIYTYLQAREDTEGNHYTLATNYRSSTAMVAAANALYEHGNGMADGAFMYQERIPFTAVAANGRDRQWQRDGKQQAALQLVWEDDDEVISKDQYVQRMSQSCAETICQILNEGKQQSAGFVNAAGDLAPATAADIAILVRDFREADAVRTALAAKGIRSVYLSDNDSVYQSEQARDLLLLLTAVVDPEDERAVRAALACRTLGLSYTELEQLGSDEQQWEQRLEQFKQLAELWHQRGVLPMLRQLLLRFDVAQRLLHNPDGGERALTNLLHLGELLQTAAAGLDGERALLRYLFEQCGEDREHSDDQIMRLESDADLIKVVTIHKSKGLQYKLVFLPFILNYKATNTRSGVLFYRDGSGKQRLTFDIDTEAKESAERERLAEDTRLLYVAITRAEYACYLGLAPLKVGRAKQPTIHLNALGRLLGHGETLGRGAIENQLRQLASADHTEIVPMQKPSDLRYVGDGELPPLPTMEPYQRQPFENWWVSSYSNLVKGKGQQQLAAQVALEDQVTEMMLDIDEPVETAPQQPQQGTIHAFPRGAEPGNFLHNLFEWASAQGRFEFDADQLQQYLQQQCANHGFAEQEPMLAQWFEQAVQVPLPLSSTTADANSAISASLAELPLALPELEFMFEAKQVDIGQLDRLVCADIWPELERPALNPITLKGMLKGFIDLTFFYQGRYYVADYKSNYLGADASCYQPEQMRTAMVEHRYELQAAIYTLALHRLLKSRLADYDYQQHIGGGLYLFVRGLEQQKLGQGALTVAPSQHLIEQLDALFSGASLHEAKECSNE